MLLTVLATGKEQPIFTSLDQFCMSISAILSNPFKGNNMHYYNHCQIPTSCFVNLCCCCPGFAVVARLSFAFCPLPCDLTDSHRGQPTHLQPGVLPQLQPPHPHVSQQHLRAGVRDERAQPPRRRQLQAGGIAPVLKFVGQELHGHGLVLLKCFFQHVQGQLAKLPVSSSEDWRKT